MTDNQLFKVLATITEVKVRRWHVVRKIVEIFDEVEIISKQWAVNKCKNNSSLDLQNLSTWSTFDVTCINLMFYIKDEKLTCLAKIYDGERLYGNREKLRFEAELILPDSFIQVIGDKINHEFHYYAIEKHEEYLEKQKEEWLWNFKQNLLNATS